MGKKTSLDKFLDDLTDRVLQDVSEGVFAKIEGKYEEVIQRFYDDYTPDFYDRTYSTFEASSGYHNSYDNPMSIKKITLGSKKTPGYRIGIRVSSDNIPDGRYNDPTEYVFNRTYMLGIHGTVREIRKKGRKPILPMKPSPRTLMLNWYAEFRKPENLKKTVDEILNDSIKRGIQRRKNNGR